MVKLIRCLIRIDGCGGHGSLLVPLYTLSQAASDKLFNRPVLLSYNETDHLLYSIPLSPIGIVDTHAGRKHIYLLVELVSPGFSIKC